MESVKRKKKCNAPKIRRKYSLFQLIKALRDVRNKKYSPTEASRIYKIPRQTLSNKLSGISPEQSSRPGPQAVLGTDIEEMIESWLLENFKRGFSLHKEALLYSVKKIVELIPEDSKHKIPFRNDTPGKGWFASFRRRHPELTEKQNGLAKTKLLPTEQKFQQWVENVETILNEESAYSVIRDPTRVFVIEEIFVKIASKCELFLIERKKTVRDVQLNENRGLNFLLATNSEGKLISPTVVCKSEQPVISDPLEPKWFCLPTESGTLNCEAFHDYMVNSFYMDLCYKEVIFPVIVFLPYDFPYLSVSLTDFCQQNGIILICSVSTCKNIETLEMVIFSILKLEWEKNLVKSENILGLKNQFASLVYNLITNQVFQPFVKGFLKSNKIYPFESEIPMKRVENKKIKRTPKIYPKTLPISYLESKIPNEILKQFRKHREQDIPWCENMDYKGLYEIWLSIVDEAVRNIEPQSDEAVNEFKSADNEWLIEEVVESVEHSYEDES